MEKLSRRERGKAGKSKWLGNRICERKNERKRNQDSDLQMLTHAPGTEGARNGSLQRPGVSRAVDGWCRTGVSERKIERETQVPRMIERRAAREEN